MDKVLTVGAILHILIEPGKIEDVGEALARIPLIIGENTSEISVVRPMSMLKTVLTRSFIP